jgi:hypothetical protein
MRRGNGETGRWVDGETERRGNGETGRWRWASVVVPLAVDAPFLGGYAAESMMGRVDEAEKRRDGEMA